MDNANSEDYKAVFDSVAGKKVLKDLEKVCFEADATFVSDSFARTSFNEGKRATLIYIKKKLNATNNIVDDNINNDIYE